MRAAIITLIATAAWLAAGPVAAGEGGASKQETIGLGVGATVGAVAGGPIGFLVGAAVGAKLGDEFHEKDVEIDALDNTLRASERRVVALEEDLSLVNGELDALSRDLERMQAKARPELVELLQAGIELDLFFRTAEHELPDQTGRRLGELGRRLAALPEVQVRLDGFADERGDEAYNHELSRKRAEYVRSILAASGVAAERISLAGHGESAAADDRPDSYALERRVSLELRVDESPKLAANPDRDAD